METDDFERRGADRFPPVAYIATDEQIDDAGAPVHYMRLSPELEALIRGMAADIRALRMAIDGSTGA